MFYLLELSNTFELPLVILRRKMIIQQYLIETFTMFLTYRMYIMYNILMKDKMKRIFEYLIYGFVKAIRAESFVCRVYIVRKACNA